MLSCYYNCFLQFFSKQFFIRELSVILRNFDGRLIIKHQVFDMLGVAFRTKY